MLFINTSRTRFCEKGHRREGRVTLPVGMGGVLWGGKATKKKMVKQRAPSSPFPLPGVLGRLYFLLSWVVKPCSAACYHIWPMPGGWK